MANLRSRSKPTIYRSGISDFVRRRLRSERGSRGNRKSRKSIPTADTIVPFEKQKWMFQLHEGTKNVRDE